MPPRGRYNPDEHEPDPDPEYRRFWSKPPEVAVSFFNRRQCAAFCDISQGHWDSFVSKFAAPGEVYRIGRVPYFHLLPIAMRWLGSEHVERRHRRK